MRLMAGAGGVPESMSVRRVLRLRGGVNKKTRNQEN